MSHLTPHRSVRITPGGAAADTTAQHHQPVEHDTSWEGLIADLATEIGLAGARASDFTARVDDVVRALDVDEEVARTRVRAALLGNAAMLGQAHAPAEAAVDELLHTWLEDPSLEANRVQARLALMHGALVAPVIPPEDDETVGEGSGGSATTLPEAVPGEPENIVGQVAYTLNDVPTGARDVVAWIEAGDSEDDRRARAQAALEVENRRAPSERRSSVNKAIAGVLGG